MGIFGGARQRGFRWPTKRFDRFAVIWCFAAVLLPFVLVAAFYTELSRWLLWLPLFLAVTAAPITTRRAVKKTRYGIVGALHLFIGVYALASVVHYSGIAQIVAMILLALGSITMLLYSDRYCRAIALVTPPNVSTASMVRPRFDILVAGAAIILLGSATAVAWWWVQPNSTWACEPNDETSGCVGQVQLDLGDVTTNERGRVENGMSIPYQSGSDISNDGERVVAIVAHHEDGDHVRSSIATFDTSTGQLDKELYLFHLDERSPPPYLVDTTQYSPDGSLVIVAGYLDGDARAPNNEFETTVIIFDVKSGEQLHRFPTTADCSRNVGLSEDNETAQCGGTLYEVESGDIVGQVESADGENQPMLASGDAFRSPNGTYCLDGGNNKTSVVACDTVGQRNERDQSDIFYTTDEPTDPNVNPNISRFDPTSTYVLSESGQITTSSSSPRRHEQTNVLQIIDLESGDAARTITTDEFTVDSAQWSGQGDYLLLKRNDGLVAVFATSA